MAKFRKAILKCGKYHSPDGVVDVTPERLRNWELQFRRMQGSKQVIPIDWDHASDPAAMQPLSLHEYNKRRSAQNTIGHLSDFRVSDSGDSAEITLDLKTPKAIEAAELNTVYVSPVLFPEWRDGNGQKYTDAITHVDMVNHPVDTSQSAFVPVETATIACALRMSVNTTPYRLSGDAMDDEQDKTEGTDKASAETDQVEGEAGTKSAENGSTLQDVVDGLAKFNIVLQDGTTIDNLLDRLHAALLTAAAHQAKDDPEDPKDGADAGNGATVQQPDVAMMSLEQSAVMQWAESQHRTSIAKRLDALCSEGRCTPAEKDAWRNQVSSVRLSLDKTSGKPQTSKLEDWIDSRESVPRGTFWTAEHRTRMSRAQVVDPPESMRGELTKDEVSDLANWALGRNRTK